VAASGPSTAIDPVIFTMEWIEVHFLGVVDSDVTTQLTVQYRNGTAESRSVAWDVLSGEELWVIPAGLQTGEIIPWGYTAINATVNRSYLGATRVVNRVDFHYQNGNYTEQLWIYWEQATGLLMELTLEIHEDSDLSMYQYLATSRGRIPTLVLSTQLSATTVIHGDNVTLTTRVTDPDQWPVDDASVQMTIEFTSLPLTSLGDGQYQTVFSTSNLTVGPHNITITANKTDYTGTTFARSLTVLAKELTATLHLTPSSVPQGSTIHISATITDALNSAVSGATVTTTTSPLSLSLSDLGNGTYHGTLTTTSLPIGIHPIHVTAQKPGYPLAETTTTFTVTPTDPVWIPYLGLAGVTGGISIGILYRWYRRRSSRSVE
jgi:hypothetical protein